jgi:outer membrane protein assembly factor BamE
MRLPSIALAALVVLTMPLGGCIYRMNIQQGNYLEGKTVAQLQVGMTRSQVRYLLGTPMVPDIFNRDRWDYLYYFKSGHLERPEQRHLVVLFKDDKVTSFKPENIPDSAPRAPDNDISIQKFPKI